MAFTTVYSQMSVVIEENIYMTVPVIMCRNRNAVLMMVNKLILNQYRKIYKCEIVGCECSRK